MSQIIVASAAVLFTAGCASDSNKAVADGARPRNDCPVMTGVGDFVGSMMRGREKHRQAQEQPVLDVAATQAGE